MVLFQFSQSETFFPYLGNPRDLSRQLPFCLSFVILSTGVTDFRPYRLCRLGKTLCSVHFTLPRDLKFLFSLLGSPPGVDRESST